MKKIIKAWAVINRGGWITGWDGSSLDIYETKKGAKLCLDSEGEPEDKVVPCEIILKLANNLKHI